MQPQNEHCGGEVKAMPAPSFIPLDGVRTMNRVPHLHRHHRPQNGNNNSYYNRTKRKRDSSSSSSVNGGGGGGWNQHGGSSTPRHDSPPLPTPVHALPPWALSHHYGYARGIIGLHEEIEDFFNWISPTQEEHLMREGVVNRIRDCIHSIWPDALLHVFGSFKTGLYLPTSDIDLVVVGHWESLPLRTLEKALLEKKIANTESLKVLDKASVPIIKLTDKLSRVRVDISFNMDSGLRSVELVKMYKRSYPPLAKLICVLKQFLLQRDLNEVFTGGLSSYCLILMVVSFLQLHHRRNASSYPANLGVLLLEFFELYGRNFNYLHTAIRVEGEGGYVSKDDVQANMPPGHRPSLLCIEDPLQPGNDVGKSSYGALQVRTAFDYAYGTLHRALQRGGGQDQRTPLARIIQVNQATLQYRAWVKDNFPVPGEREHANHADNKSDDRVKKDAPSGNRSPSRGFKPEASACGEPAVDLSSIQRAEPASGGHLEPLTSRLSAIHRAESYDRLPRRQQPDADDDQGTTDSSRDRSPGGGQAGEDEICSSGSSSADGADDSSSGGESPTARPTSPSSTTHLGSAMSISPASSEVGSSISSRMSTVSTPPASASPIPRRSLTGGGGVVSPTAGSSMSSPSSFPPLPRQTAQFAANTPSSFHHQHNGKAGRGHGSSPASSSASWNRKQNKKKSETPNRADLDTNWRASAVVTTSNCCDRNGSSQGSGKDPRDRADKDNNWRGRLAETAASAAAAELDKGDRGGSSSSSLDRREKKRLQTSSHRSGPKPPEQSNPQSPVRDNPPPEPKAMSEDEEKPASTSAKSRLRAEPDSAGPEGKGPSVPQTKQHICDRTNNTSTQQHQQSLNNSCDQNLLSASSASQRGQKPTQHERGASKTKLSRSVSAGVVRNANAAAPAAVKFRASASLQQESLGKSGGSLAKKSSKTGKADTAANSRVIVDPEVAAKKFPVSESSGSLGEENGSVSSPTNNGSPPQKKASTDPELTVSTPRHYQISSEVTRGKAKKKKKRRERERGNPANTKQNQSEVPLASCSQSGPTNQPASHNKEGEGDTPAPHHQNKSHNRSSRFSCIAGPRKPKR